MDEKKEPTSKKINIKNKKEATKALSKKSSSKGKKTSSKKTTPKKTTTKKETVTKKVQKEISKEVSLDLKEENKTAKKKVEKKVVAPKNKTTPKTTTIKKKDTKTKDNKKSTTKKEKETTKLVIPKEWQDINKTKKEQKDKEKVSENDRLKGRFRKSIFEEVDEKTFQIQKQKEKAALKKTFLIFLIIAVIIALSIYLIFKYNDDVKKKLKVYDVYRIGEKVKLSDESIWYVAVDSDSSNPNVKLLSENIIDVNYDSKYDAKDKKKYNSTNIAEYDILNENSVAQYLNDTYKVELQARIGNIEEISLLTSKEFVKIREKMGFGYEWSVGNWLANQTLGTWWIISAQNEQVYAVTSSGVYKLYTADSLNYIRPTITISKELVEKIEETDEEDLMPEIIKDIF